MLGFNDTPALVNHFVSSPREREKRDRRDSGGGETAGKGRTRKMNEREETEGIKTFLLYPYLLEEYQPLPNCNPVSTGRPGDAGYTTSLPHTPPPTPHPLANDMVAP